MTDPWGTKNGKGLVERKNMNDRYSVLIKVLMMWMSWNGFAVYAFSSGVRVQLEGRSPGSSRMDGLLGWISLLVLV